MISFSAFLALAANNREPSHSQLHIPHSLRLPLITGHRFVLFYDIIFRIPRACCYLLGTVLGDLAKLQFSV
jgi:hypothetical protein